GRERPAFIAAPATDLQDEWRRYRRQVQIPAGASRLHATEGRQRRARRRDSHTGDWCTRSHYGDGVERLCVQVGGGSALPVAGDVNLRRRGQSSRQNVSHRADGRQDVATVRWYTHEQILRTWKPWGCDDVERRLRLGGGRVGP